MNISGHLSQQNSQTPFMPPLLLRRATAMTNPSAVPQERIFYDPRTQISREITIYGNSERTGCTKASHSTPKVDKDPEGDYAADDY